MEPLLEQKFICKNNEDQLLAQHNTNSLNNDIKNTAMVSSIGSILDDTTPSDSGVQLLDSESSELMIESITSQNGFDFDDKISTCPTPSGQMLPDLLLPTATVVTTVGVASESPPKQIIMTKSDFENSNIIEGEPPDVTNTAMITTEDVMNTSTCSTFDAENIVYRRRVKKPNGGDKQAPKKRVSFHEDILKNTRTDNIHIEHGFITYKNGRKTNMVAGRYSWCSEGDGETTLASKKNPKTEDGRVVYRNACSDVLDYANADIYENLGANCLKYDNSGVFEYRPGRQERKNKNIAKVEANLYKCSCSSSNSSLDSGSEDAADKNSNRCNYGQAKSNSCDCIGANNNNNNFIGESCYFSEPSIDNLNEHRKSVWSKEKKPKSSCLKKTKRHTDIIQEHDLTHKVKKFNVHDVNNLIDNSKMIFGSLKSIFTIPLPERGVPEGSEDVQSVYECIPDSENTERDTSPIRQKPFLSKSLDGGVKPNDTAGGDETSNRKKKFIHNVDQQLRRNNEEDLYAPTRQNSDDEKQNSSDEINSVTENTAQATEMAGDINSFRNKFIINCESTVFEHTGVSYTFEAEAVGRGDPVNVGEKATPVPNLTPATPSVKTTNFMTNPIKQTFENIFKTVKETVRSPTSTSKVDDVSEYFEKFAKLDGKKPSADAKFSIETKQVEQKIEKAKTNRSKSSTTSSDQSDVNSVCSDVTSSTNTTTTNNLDNFSDYSWQKVYMIRSLPTSSSSKLRRTSHQEQLQSQNSRHLQSPMKRRLSAITRYERGRMSPDLFNSGVSAASGSFSRDSKSVLSEEFDDILAITTDPDKNESDIVILDYPESNVEKTESNHLLKPPKSSLINRFLRNVTQKKIMESSIRKNNFFAEKINSEKQLFTGNLYMKGVKPKNLELIEDLNAEIAMEIEMSGLHSPRRELVGAEAGTSEEFSRFELGIGEISIDIFNGNCLHILSDVRETLMKVFKLYTGYSREGYMTPVLVFLTDRTMYVTDLVRNRLCNKFVLPYSELDVILMSPYGNTVLLSNGSRELQQVLLAGGPYPAHGLVANLELCARRGGSILPAVGQLTLEHLAPLQTFVRENTSMSRDDDWVYYAVVNVPSGALGSDEQEPLGPNVKGFLMHRRLEENGSAKENWSAGYFLLKAGVLYMFHDSTQKLPTWAMALAECQGARRAAQTGRPHCFEILRRNDVLQLAAPDEYVASEWLQALVQSASGLFEMQEKHKTLGCTLVMTDNHLITLREDFRAPLRKVNKTVATSGEKINQNSSCKTSPTKENYELNRSFEGVTSLNTTSALNSPISSIEKSYSHSPNSSTPNKAVQQSNQTQSIITSTVLEYNTACDGGASVATATSHNGEKSYTSMSSFYGKNSGVEVLTCAAIKELVAIRIPSHNDSWWCILEFSCQEVRENSGDLVIIFASSCEMQRFLRMLENLWQAKNNDLFPVTILDEDDIVSEQCTRLYMDINRSWEPLLSAALGYPL